MCHQGLDFSTLHYTTGDRQLKMSWAFYISLIENENLLEFQHIYWIETYEKVILDLFRYIFHDSFSE